MSVPLEESRLRFEFGGSWQVFRYDSCSCQRAVNVLQGELDGKAEGTKAVDFVAAHENELYLFEVKNLRDFERATRGRLEKEIHLELGLKVRDTLAGLIGGVRCGKEMPEAVRDLVRGIADSSRSIRVVVWIERDDPPGYKRWLSIADDQIEDRIKAKLKWLHARVAIWNTESPPLPDLVVKALP